MARPKKIKENTAAKVEITSEVSVVPAIPSNEVNVGGYDPKDIEILKKHLEDFKTTPAQLCEDLDYGSVTLIREYLTGTRLMVNPFKNKFLAWDKMRRKNKSF